MFKTKQKEIHEIIERLVSQKNCTYIEAALQYSTDNSLDESFIGEVINKIPKLKAKIELEAEELNFLKKRDRIMI